VKIALDPSVTGQHNTTSTSSAAEPAFNEDISNLNNNPYVQVMMDAIASRKGIEILCDSEEDANVVRFRYYAVRRKLHRKGIYSLDDLIFKIRGSSVLIKPGPKVTVKIL
jgi:hypothetical protein